MVSFILQDILLRCDSLSVATYPFDKEEFYRLYGSKNKEVLSTKLLISYYHHRSAEYSQPDVGVQRVRDWATSSGILSDDDPQPQPIYHPTVAVVPDDIRSHLRSSLDASWQPEECL